MRRIILFIILATALLLSACNKGVAYFHYSHTPVQGWEKNDTLFFDVDSIEQAAHYNAELGLRINGAYPFMSLTLIVEQSLFHDGQPKPYAEHCDTLNCRLIRKDGTYMGNGLSYIQYDFPITSYPLLSGDSIHIRVRHDMKREILPGISDIGIKIKR